LTGRFNPANIDFTKFQTGIIEYVIIWLTGKQQRRGLVSPLPLTFTSEDRLCRIHKDLPFSGFNFSDIDSDVVLQVKEYLLRKINYARSSYDIVDVQRRNLSQWQRVSVRNIELDAITWDGVIHGKVQMGTADGEYDYSPHQKALLFGVIAVGALSTILFVIWGMEKFGCRKTFTVVGLLSTVSTALCPVAASFGFVLFLIVRFVQGIGVAACFPVVGSVTSAWAELTGVLHACFSP